MSESHSDMESGLSDTMTKGDTLASGIVFMLLLTVVQRVIGFGRSILFCGLLQDDELGRWSLAFSFLFLAAPLFVLGLPGSFGRYVAHYRQRGQLRVFLRRTIVTSAILGSVGVVTVVLLAEQWAWLIFGDRSLAVLIQLLAVTLAVVMVVNFLTELLTAMKQVRAVSLMQFVSSLLFAILAIGLLHFTDLQEKAVIVAYGVALFVGIGVVIRPLYRVSREASVCQVGLSHSRMWEKLVPFAAWIWVTNFLVNLFEATDRFMIVHLSTAGSSITESMIGQYHASRIVPFLLVGVSGTVAAIVLPHMSHDWESGKRQAVSRQHTLTLKIAAFVLMAVGAGILIGAPVLFSWILQHKYDQGMEVLPLTLTYCVWFSLTILAQNYLWCAERARWGSFSVMIGLAANIGCNVALFPVLGLPGAVLATAIANAVTLGLVLFFSSRIGFPVDRNLIICCGLPAILAFGPWSALAGLLAMAYLVGEKGWLFTAAERDELRDVFDAYRTKMWRWRVGRQTAFSGES